MYSYAYWNYNGKPIALIYPRASDLSSLKDILTPGHDQVLSIQESGKLYSSVFTTILELSQRHIDIDQIMVCKNSQCVFTQKLLSSYSQLLGSLSENYKDSWALASPSGLDSTGQRLIASYYAQAPCFPTARTSRLLRDTFVDFYAINPRILQRLKSHIPVHVSDGFELVYLNVALLNHVPSLSLPGLSCPVNGGMMSRDLSIVIDDLKETKLLSTRQQLIPSLMGDLLLEPKPCSTNSEPNFDTAIEDVDQALTTMMNNNGFYITVSVVVRTCFKRMPLLRRLIASLLQAQTDGIGIEIVISTDIEKKQAIAFYTQIAENHHDLNLKLVTNEHTVENSRVRNLLGGIEACKFDYVWIVDDDDYVAAESFTHIRKVLYHNTPSFIFCDSAIMTETWHHTDKRSVLTSAHQTGHYSGSNWRYLFSGVNQTPICGFISPREYLQERIKHIPMQYDLSEDYALILGVLASVQLPPIVEINKPMCHISVREGSDNTVTMHDRRPWTADIHGFLRDLLSNNEIASEGFWSLLVSRSQLEAPLKAYTDDALAKTIEKLRDRNRQLEKSNRLLQAEIRDVRLANTVFVKQERRFVPSLPNLSESDSGRDNRTASAASSTQLLDCDLKL